MEKYEKPVMEVIDIEKDIETIPGLPGCHGKTGDEPSEPTSGGTP